MSFFHLATAWIYSQFGKFLKAVHTYTLSTALKLSEETC